jgi:hypothetical protein
MADRAVTEPGFFVWLTNALASHPVLLWRMHALRDRRRPGRLLWRPKTPWLWREPIRPGEFDLPPMVGFTPTPTRTPIESAFPAIDSTVPAIDRATDALPTLSAPTDSGADPIL